MELQFYKMIECEWTRYCTIPEWRSRLINKRYLVSTVPANSKPENSPKARRYNIFSSRFYNTCTSITQDINSNLNVHLPLPGFGCFSFFNVTNVIYKRLNALLLFVLSHTISIFALLTFETMYRKLHTVKYTKFITIANPILTMYLDN